jgi:hypothetical protein
MFVVSFSHCFILETLPEYKVFPSACKLLSKPTPMSLNREREREGKGIDLEKMRESQRKVGVRHMEF